MCWFSVSRSSLVLSTLPAFACPPHAGFGGVDVVLLRRCFVGVTAYSLYNFSRNSHLVQVCGRPRRKACHPFHFILFFINFNRFPYGAKSGSGPGVGGSNPFSRTNCFMVRTENSDDLRIVRALKESPTRKLPHPCKPAERAEISRSALLVVAPSAVPPTAPVLFLSTVQTFQALQGCR